MEALEKSAVGCSQLAYRLPVTLDTAAQIPSVHGRNVICNRFCLAVYSVSDCTIGLSVPPTRYSISLFDVRPLNRYSKVLLPHARTS